MALDRYGMGFADGESSARADWEIALRENTKLFDDGAQITIQETIRRINLLERVRLINSGDEL